jgi:hypothetical protein
MIKPGLILAAACVLPACSQDGAISASIGEAVHRPEARTLDLAQVVNFEWEAVFFFSPYTPRDDICRELRVEQQCAAAVPFESSDDGLMTLAFLRAGRVVRVEPHSRRNGDFTPVPGLQPIPRTRAVFRIVRESQAAGEGGTWTRLVLQ